MDGSAILAAPWDFLPFPSDGFCNPYRRHEVLLQRGQHRIGADLSRRVAGVIVTTGEPQARDSKKQNGETFWVRQTCNFERAHHINLHCESDLPRPCQSRPSATERRQRARKASGLWVPPRYSRRGCERRHLSARVRRQPRSQRRRARPVFRFFSCLQDRSGRR